MTISLNDLIQFLDDDQKDLKQLHLILEKERNALSNRELTELKAAQIIKQRLLQQLESRAVRKTEYLKTATHPKKPPAFKLLVQVSKSDVLKEKWDSVQQLLSTCQQANAINGKIISHSQRRTEKMMEILSGKSGETKLYGAEGKQQTHSSGYVLAKA